MKRVLVADDEAAIRRILMRVLTREGYEVAEATDGAAAEQLVAAACDDGRRVDLLLLDVHMPVMDGLALHRRLCERGICPPTVIITGDPHGEKLRPITENDDVVVLEKPFRRDDIVEAARAALAASP